jgi:hypothetical protein
MTTSTASGSTVRLGEADTPLSARPHATPGLFGRLLCFFNRHKDREVARFSAKDLTAIIGHECARCRRRTLQIPIIPEMMDKAAARRSKRQEDHAIAWRDRSPEHAPKPRGRKPRSQQQPAAEPQANGQSDLAGEHAHG